MAAVLAGTGFYLYTRRSSQLTQAIDRELRLRAQDLGAFVGRPGAALARESKERLIEHGESYAQLVTPSGRVVDWSRPLGPVRILSRSELDAARHRPFYVEESSVPGLDEP